MKIEKGMEEKGEKERKRGAKERRERRENYFKELHLKSATTDSVHHRSSLTSVLISKDCYNYYRLSVLKRQIFLLSVLDARSLRSRCQQGHAPPETLGKILLHLFLAYDGGWQSLALYDLLLASHPPLPLSSLSFSLSAYFSSSSCKNTSHIGLMAHPSPV